jgi:hypothetical protein
VVISWVHLVVTNRKLIFVVSKAVEFALAAALDDKLFPHVVIRLR